MMLVNFGGNEARREALTERGGGRHQAPPDFALSDSPRYIGRAIAALAADPDRGKWNQKLVSSARIQRRARRGTKPKHNRRQEEYQKSVRSGDLARHYGFSDIDGSRPDDLALHGRGRRGRQGGGPERVPLGLGYRRVNGSSPMSVHNNSSHPLDYPIWTALTTTQQALAEGDARARRYPTEITPFAATRGYVARKFCSAWRADVAAGHCRAVHAGCREPARRIQGRAGGYRRADDRDAGRNASQRRRYRHPRCRRRSSDDRTDRAHQARTVLRADP